MATRMWLLGMALALGCDRTPRQTATDSVEPPTETATRKTLPRPDPFRMAYDPTTRILSLYDLADENAHWMLVSPRNKLGEPVSVLHGFMDEMSLDDVLVFYVAPNGATSPRVSLREIVCVNVAHRR